MLNCCGKVRIMDALLSQSSIHNDPMKFPNLKYGSTLDLFDIDGSNSFSLFTHMI